MHRHRLYLPSDDQASPSLGNRQNSGADQIVEVGPVADSADMRVLTGCCPSAANPRVHGHGDSFAISERELTSHMGVGATADPHLAGFIGTDVYPASSADAGSLCGDVRAIR